MKKFKKIFALIFTIVLSVNYFLIQPVHAASLNINNAANDPYATRKSEIINIDGINYTYQYFYENGNRVIQIINNSSNEIDIVKYDKNSSTIYLNDNVFASINSVPLSKGQSYTTNYSGWETLSTGSHYISWAQGVSASVIAAAIAVYLGSIGTGGVIAAMGVGALGVIAGSCSGGTLYLELQMFSNYPSLPQYRYLWTFTASTGDSYGPYSYFVYM